MEWEQIDAYHQRSEVFGGWLVKSYEDLMHTDSSNAQYNGYDFRVAMV